MNMRIILHIIVNPKIHTRSYLPTTNLTNNSHILSCYDVSGVECHQNDVEIDNNLDNGQPPTQSYTHPL